MINEELNERVAFPAGTFVKVMLAVVYVGDLGLIEHFIQYLSDASDWFWRPIMVAFTPSMVMLVGMRLTF